MYVESIIIVCGVVIFSYRVENFFVTLLHAQNAVFMRGNGKF